MAFYLSRQSLATRCQTLSVDECLTLCRDIVVRRVREARNSDTLCAVSIEATYAFLEFEESSGRFAPGTTVRWLGDLEAELGIDAIRKRIEAGIRHKKRLAPSEAIVSKQWNVGLYDIVNDSPFTKTISPSLAERFAQLALILPLDDAREEIRKAIVHRTTTTTSRLQYVCIRDIEGILLRFPNTETQHPPSPTTIAASAPLSSLPKYHGSMDGKDKGDQDIEGPGSDAVGPCQRLLKSLHELEQGGEGVLDGVSCPDNSHINGRGADFSSIGGNDRQTLKDTVNGVNNQSGHQKCNEDDNGQSQGSAPGSLQSYGNGSDSDNATIPSEHEVLRPINHNVVDSRTRRKRKAQGDRQYRPPRRRCSSLPSIELARGGLDPSLSFLSDMDDTIEDVPSNGHGADDPDSDPEIYGSIMSSTSPNAGNKENTQFSGSMPHSFESGEQRYLDSTRGYTSGWVEINSGWVM
ncbi:MAG: hypothetical protein Q9219_007276 [cf. Caloplaca sp. 3 TL-2023]